MKKIYSLIAFLAIMSLNSCNGGAFYNLPESDAKKIITEKVLEPITLSFDKEINFKTDEELQRYLSPDFGQGLLKYTLIKRPEKNGWYTTSGKISCALTEEGIKYINKDYDSKWNVKVCDVEISEIEEITSYDVERRATCAFKIKIKEGTETPFIKFIDLKEKLEKTHQANFHKNDKEWRLK